MVKTVSQMLALGTQAPSFALPDVTTGQIVTNDNFNDAKALAVFFICNHCPFVIHVRHELAAIARDYRKQGLATVAICSNDVQNYPDDSPQKMKEEVRIAGYDFPYLYDQTQQVAKDYHAACTPDLFLFDARQKLVYRGQLDDSRPGNKIEINGCDFRSAIRATLEGKQPLKTQKATIGCNIKWKAGNAPDYFSQ